MPYKPENWGSDHAKSPEVRRLHGTRAWQETRAYVLALDNGRCCYCGRDDLPLDVHHTHCPHPRCYPNRAHDPRYLRATCRRDHTTLRAKHRPQPLRQPQPLAEH
jgi:5-methylcytosine-specific restriction endonuclease McrA